MPTLTVIMPVYNASPFIKEAVHSLLNQTFTDFELWIIDDGSSDNSMHLVEQLDDSRIQLFYNKKNIGKAKTVNEYAQKITTPFFTITDADDVSDFQKIEKQLNAFAVDPSLMMCGTSCYAITESGFVFREIHLQSDEREIKIHAHLQSQFMGATTMMRKEILHTFPELYRSYFSNQVDADLCCRILSQFKTSNLNDLLYFYRIVPSSISRKKITPLSLNSYKLIGELYLQRKKSKNDWLEQGKTKKADDFMKSIELKYDSDPSFLPRHTAFFHLYWGQLLPAINEGYRAFTLKPLKLKNGLSLALIIFRSGLFYLNRVFNKTHYTQLINRRK
jgi:glycosyltransferase involved in cell wall biosynthesis